MLYNEFRPSSFKDFCGQDKNLETLREQIVHKNFKSAYLFTGLRGTGKTSLARIMARVVNCSSPTEDGPCNKCSNCLTIANNSTHDFIELDAASQNSIDSIKELISTTSILPTSLNKKVYIIDEIHNLSANAFSALLKTLEEPPESCIFFLCTTEQHKIPATIISRCSIYKFKALPIEVIKKKLIDVLHAKKVDYEEEAIEIIAKNAQGSLRDSLSLLDIFIDMPKIKIDFVKEALGILDEQLSLDFISGLAKANTNNVLALLQKSYEEGKNLTHLVDNMINGLTDVVVYSSSVGKAKLYNSQDYVNQIAQISKINDISRYFWLINSLSDLRSSIRNAIDPYLDIQLEFIKCCTPTLFDNSELAILNRIDTVEKQIEELKKSLKSNIESPTDTINHNDLNNLAEEEIPFDTDDNATNSVVEDSQNNLSDDKNDTTLIENVDINNHAPSMEQITKEEKKNDIDSIIGGFI